jgi:hypothetical protein
MSASGHGTTRFESHFRVGVIDLNERWAMDDSLELPNSLPNRPEDLQPEDDDQSSGDEDGGLDWTKLM